MASLILYFADHQSVSHILKEGQPATVGRHPESLIYIEDPSVSVHHAILNQDTKDWYVQDLGSSNGTSINGAPIEEAKLGDGDRVNFGNVQGIFYLSALPVVPEVPQNPVTPVIPVPIKRSPVTTLPDDEDSPISESSANRRAKRKMAAAGDAQDTRPSEGLGCTTILIVTLLLTASLVGGMYIRHYNETGRNLIVDSLNAILGGLPKIVIEKESE